MSIQELSKKGYHIMAKPIGPKCNLNCHYCFYTEKESFFPQKKDFKMSNDVLETFINKYINSQDIPEIQFVWQGGEPTLLGTDFFHRVIHYQKKHSNGKKIINSLQTNGILLNDKWCKFLKTNDFIVGISLDGPMEFHDQYRVDQGGKPTFNKVIKAISLLKRYEIPFNVLVCVTRESSKHPLEIYHFLKEQGIKYVQFTPIVERLSHDDEAAQGLKHTSPPTFEEREHHNTVSPYSVESKVYGDFLIKIFDEWVRHDVGLMFVMNFEWALESWLGLPSTICIFSDQCGSALAIEHNGDIYSCDHFVYPKYKLGNILKDDPNNMLALDQHKKFGANKKASLPQKCLDCEALFACQGECPRHRFMTTESGEPGLSYLCDGYYNFFEHIHKYMKVMVQLIENGLPTSNVMDVIKGTVYVINDKKKTNSDDE